MDYSSGSDIGCGVIVAYLGLDEIPQMKIRLIVSSSLLCGTKQFVHTSMGLYSNA